ncbi:MAG: phenylalanine--tRNA ligase beta subunit-related protein [Thermoplasmata archaeon]
MELRIEEDVRKAYPELHLAYLEIRGMKIGTGSDKVTNLLKEESEKLLRTLTLDTVKDREDFRAYRDFFWRIGVDPTKTRPAAEALVRRILKGASLPRINDFVDAYNISSAESGIPIAAFDLAVIEEDIVLRMSKAGETFLGIGMEAPRTLQEGVPVMSSGDSLIAIYPYRDADESKITVETSDAVLITCGVPGIATEKLIEAAKKARDCVLMVCGGTPSKIRCV